MTTREERKRVAAGRYRSAAVEAVARLIVLNGVHEGLLRGEDLMQAQERAAELRARMSGPRARMESRTRW
jgi:hypothetical protein